MVGMMFCATTLSPILPVNQLMANRTFLMLPQLQLQRQQQRQPQRQQPQLQPQLLRLLQEFCQHIARAHLALLNVCQLQETNL